MNQEDIEEYLEKMLEQSERDIDAVFANRLKELNDLLARLHRKYNDGGTISRTEIYKYNRFEKEMDTIKDLIHDDYKKVYQTINQLMKDQYKENLLRSGYVYEMTSMMDMGYQIPKAETIKAAVENPIAGLKLPTLMKEHRNEIIRNIRIELASGIQAGEGYADMAKRLEERVNFSRSKARRVARTEAGRAQSSSRVESIEQAEQHTSNTERFWMATLDKRTRSSHRRLDGESPNNEGYFTYRNNKTVAPSLWMGPNSASLNINCRCDLGLKINNEFPDSRRARNYNDSQYQQRLADRMDELMANEGLTEKQAQWKAKREIYPPNKVIQYQNYDEWYKDLVKEE